MLSQVWATYGPGTISSQLSFLILKLEQFVLIVNGKTAVARLGPFLFDIKAQIFYTTVFPSKVGHQST